MAGQSLRPDSVVNWPNVDEDFHSLPDLINSAKLDVSRAVDICFEELGVEGRLQKEAARSAMVQISKQFISAMNPEALLRRLRTAIRVTPSAIALQHFMIVLAELRSDWQWTEWVDADMGKIIDACIQRLPLYAAPETASSFPSATTTTMQPSSTVELAEAAADALSSYGIISLLSSKQLEAACERLAILLNLYPGSREALRAIEALQDEAAARDGAGTGDSVNGGTHAPSQPLRRLAAAALSRGGGPSALTQCMVAAAASSTADAAESASRCLRHFLMAEDARSEEFVAACMAAKQAGVLSALAKLFTFEGSSAPAIATDLLLIIATGARGADAAAAGERLLDAGGLGQLGCKAALNNLDIRLGRANEPLSAAMATALLDTANDLVRGLAGGGGSGGAGGCVDGADSPYEILERLAPAIWKAVRCILLRAPPPAEDCGAIRGLSEDIESDSGGTRGFPTVLQEASARVYETVVRGMCAPVEDPAADGLQLPEQLLLPLWVRTDAEELARRALVGGRDPPHATLRCLAACLDGMQRAGALGGAAELRSLLAKMPRRLRDACSTDRTMLRLALHVLDSASPAETAAAAASNSAAVAIGGGAAAGSPAAIGVQPDTMMLGLAAAALDAARKFAASTAAGDWRSLSLLVDTIAVVARVLQLLGTVGLGNGAALVVKLWQAYKVACVEAPSHGHGLAEALAAAGAKVSEVSIAAFTRPSSAVQQVQPDVQTPRAAPRQGHRQGQRQPLLPFRLVAAAMPAATAAERPAGASANRPAPAAAVAVVAGARVSPPTAAEGPRRPADFLAPQAIVYTMEDVEEIFPEIDQGREAREKSREHGPAVRCRAADYFDTEEGGGGASGGGHKRLRQR